MGAYTINEKFQAVPTPSAERPPTDRQVRLAEMFGLGLDDTTEVTLYDGLALDVQPGDLVFITGPSGSGKSVLVRALVRALRDGVPDGGRVVDLAALHVAADRPAIDLPTAPFETALALLSAAGLAEAFALLRPVADLSDGQRYRLRLALALDRLLADSEEGTRGLRVLVADEFCSTLDRCCARAVAYRVRRLVDRHGVTVVAASAHDDLVDDLAPDVLVTKHAGPGAEVRYADPARGASRGEAPRGGSPDPPRDKQQRSRRDSSLATLAQNDKGGRGPYPPRHASREGAR
ncbi:MAG: ATP-binding cassette domain-containing protein [Planctomycetes bacterium]|nr:ATP-binding cassette domain-containing protein [Planctomycetota bacterium]